MHSDWKIAFRQWAEQLLDGAAGPLCLRLNDAAAVHPAAALLAWTAPAKMLFVTADQHAAENLAAALHDYMLLLDDRRPVWLAPEVKGLRREWLPENEAALCAALEAASAPRPALFIAGAAALLTRLARPAVFHGASCNGEYKSRMPPRRANSPGTWTSISWS